MKKLMTALALTGGVLLLTGCNDDDDSGRASVRVIHASPDAPPVNVEVNGNEVVTDLDYRASSETLRVRDGRNTVEVFGILPGSDTVSVIGPADLQLDDGVLYDVIAVGSVADIEPLVLEDDGERTDADSVRVRVAHLAANAPEVDVHVTAPGAALSADTVLGTFEFKGSLGPVEVPAGDYQIRVTLAGDPTTVAFDSGTVSLASGQDLLIGAVTNTDYDSTGNVPVSLMVVSGDDVSLIRDVNAGSGVRVVHASGDAPAVDVFVNDAASGITNLAFGSVAPTAKTYAALDAGDNNLKVSPTGLGTGSAVINADVTLTNGVAYTVLAVNEVAAIEPLVVVDDLRTIATEARLRLIHGSVSAGTVDIYVVGQGDALNGIAPVLEDVPFKADSGFLPVAAGDYDVVVTPVGAPGTEAIRASVSLETGKRYAAVATDDITTPAFSVIALDDLAP